MASRMAMRLVSRRCFMNKPEKSAKVIAWERMCQNIGKKLPENPAHLAIPTALVVVLGVNLHIYYKAYEDEV